MTWSPLSSLPPPLPTPPQKKRKGRLINRPLQSMKTGGNNPDKRQIWSLAYKTNFNCTPFFKSSSEWRTGELKPCGCRICFSLIALSGYLTQWQMTKTPPVTARLSLCLSQSILCGFTHIHTHILTHCQVSAGAPAKRLLSYGTKAVWNYFLYTSKCNDNISIKEAYMLYLMSRSVLEMLTDCGGFWH